MQVSPAITRRPLRLAYDAELDVLVACEYGAVCLPGIEELTAELSCRLGFLLRAPAGEVIGFALDGLAELDVDGHLPCLWGAPRFRVPLLGGGRASIAEIALRARTALGGRSTPDVVAVAAARAHARAGEHAAAERELRTALACGELSAHLTLAGCLSAQHRHREAYEHARAYSELAPRDPWGFAWIGRTALELGEAAEAERALRRALRLERHGGPRTPARAMLRALRARGRGP